MNVLGERYLCGTPNEEVRTLVPVVEVGNIPWLHLPWIDELDGELQLRENLLDLATAIRHVDTATTIWGGGVLEEGEVRHRKRLYSCGEIVEPWYVSHEYFIVQLVLTVPRRSLGKIRTHLGYYIKCN